MADSSTYVLDANVFIEAARRYYAFDLAPRFWEILISHAEQGRIRSIDRVKKELERGNDELACWAKEEFTQSFVSTNNGEIMGSYADIMTWVQNHNQFSDAAKADFAGGADGWLTAYARVEGCVIVTHEVPAPDVKRKVPIPNVCQQFNVPFVDTFGMLRKLGVRFE